MTLNSSSRAAVSASVSAFLAVVALFLANDSPALRLEAAQNGAARASTVDPSDDEPFPDAQTLAATRDTAEKRPLFATTEPLVFSLVGNIGQIQRDRDENSDKTYPATIVVSSNGRDTEIPVQVRTRGHSRLKPDACTFAPLRIVFPQNPVGTVFEGQRSLKLGTHCRDQGEYPSYVVREYPVYRMFNILTPRSFRARLAEVHYVESGSRKTMVRQGLLLENDDDVARRMEGRISETVGSNVRRLDAPTATLMSVFEYMIGNTDVSIRVLHNVRIVLTRTGARYTVPYDFDFSGVVAAHYAEPNPLLKLASTRTRLYLGPCRTPEQLEETLQKFRAGKDQLMAAWDNVPGLKAGYVANAKKYLDGFYRTISTPQGVKKAFIDGCEKQPYM